MCLCVSVRVSAMCTHMPTVSKIRFMFLELVFQVVVSCLVWVLGNKILFLEEQ